MTISNLSAHFSAETSDSFAPGTRQVFGHIYSGRLSLKQVLNSTHVHVNLIYVIRIFLYEIKVEPLPAKIQLSHTSSSTFRPRFDTGTVVRHSFAYFL